jgi:hypothetical protein
MIELPQGPWTAVPQFNDRGILQEGLAEGETKRLDRKGSRFSVSVSAGPFYAEQAQVWVARIIAGRSQGIRIPYPLQVSQGNAGAAVVDGAGQSGTTLNLRGANVGYACREGYFLSIEDENGRHYLHNVLIGGRVAGDGTLSITLTSELRWPFLDGANVYFAKPMIEGLVMDDNTSWALTGDMVTPIQFTIKEAA